MRGTLHDRFWAKVHKGKFAACWNWLGSKSAKGYGQISQGKRGLRPLQAHRVSWEMHFGAILAGMCVLHRCDNPSCVRPDHLFLGTIVENDLDRDRKNRVAHGSRHCRATLVESQVVDIRRRYWIDREPLKLISKQLGVSVGALNHVVRFSTWRRVPLDRDVAERMSQREVSHGS